MGTEDGATKDGFVTWMNAVDRKLIELCGMGSSDISDCNYRDMYDDGYTPEEAAYEAVDYEING